MVEIFITPFLDYAFMRRALAGVLALSLSGAPLGLFLILRRNSLAGDAISHAILPGAALGYFFAGLSLPAMALGGLASGLAAALGAGLAARWTDQREDSSLAAFYLISLALGVTIISARGSSVDLLHVLFGDVLGLDDRALIVLAAISSVTLLGFSALYRPLVMDTLDPQFLAAAAPGAGLTTQLAFLALLTLNLLAGFQALGALMAVGLMILPAAGARLWTRRLETTIALAILAAFASGYFGLVVSFRYGLASGPAIVLAAGGFYLISVLLGRSGGLVRLLPRRRHFEG